jgi:predicted small metal-binding protein
MAFKLVCAETGAKCPFEVVTDTKDELIQHVGIHARMAHPEMASNPPSPEMVNALIHEV